MDNIQCESKNPPLKFSGIFPTWFGIFCPNFTRLFHVPLYAILQIFIQLSPTLTKLRHIKCDHPACVSADGGHFEHFEPWIGDVWSVVAVWHNFFKVAGNLPK